MESPKVFVGNKKSEDDIHFEVLLDVTGGCEKYIVLQSCHVYAVFFLLLLGR